MTDLDTFPALGTYIAFKCAVFGRDGNALGTLPGAGMAFDTPGGEDPDLRQTIL